MDNVTSIANALRSILLAYGHKAHAKSLRVEGNCIIVESNLKVTFFDEERKSFLVEDTAPEASPSQKLFWCDDEAEKGLTHAFNVAIGLKYTVQNACELYTLGKYQKIRT